MSGPETTRLKRVGRGEAAALGAVLVLAAALRLWGIRWGLPDATHLFSYHPDEYHSLRGALALASGDPNPHFFNYGSLYLYMVGVACLWHDAVLGGADLIGALVRGHAAHVEMAAWTLDARLVVVACALGTVVAVWAAGRRLAGPVAGLVAGAVMAVMPLHVLNSHYATVDVPETLFVALCLLGAVRVMDAPTLRNVALAGAMAGLAASVKYNGAVVLVAPLVALVMARKGVPAKALAARVGVLVGAAAAAFALTSPYVLLAWPEAWKTISFELKHMRVGESPVKEAYPNGWLFHLHPALVFMGLALWLCRGEERRRLVPLVVFGALWFAMIGAAGVRYARYELPLEPVAALCAAAGLLGAWARPGKLRAGLASVLAVWCLAGVATSAVRDSAMATQDPRRDMLQALQSEYAGKRVGMALEPWFNLPAVDYCNGGKALRDNLLFARFKRPVVEAVVTGVDAERIREEAPEAFIASNFELDPVFNAVSPANRAVWDLLGSGYRPGHWRGTPIVSDHPVLSLIWRRRHPWGQDPVGKYSRGAWTASDSRYPFPDLWLFVRSPSNDTEP